MIQAVIFDLDGTLVHSERLKAQTYAVAAAELGQGIISEQEVVDAYREVAGSSRQEVAQFLLERFHLENAARNRVEDQVTALCGDLRAVSGQYPLVLANILYQILLGLAPELCARVAPGGNLILSGFLVGELDSATEVYGAHGLRKSARDVEGEWGALLFRRP